MRSRATTRVSFAVILAILVSAQAAGAALRPVSAPEQAPILTANEPTPAGTYEGRLLAPGLALAGEPLAPTGGASGFTGVSRETIAFPANPSGWQYALASPSGVVRACFLDADDAPAACADTGAAGTLPAGTARASVELLEGMDVAWTLTVTDGSAPLVAIHAPSPGQWLTSRDVAVSFTATDDGSGIASVLCSLDGSADGTPCANGAVLGFADDGEHSVQVEATDFVGHAASASVQFLIDSVAPSVSILSPSPGEWSTTRDVTLGLTASDENGVSSIHCRINAGPAAPCGDGSTVSFPSDGQHTLQVTAADPAGNTASASVTFSIDSLAPAIEIHSPAEGSTVAGSASTLLDTGDAHSCAISHNTVTLVCWGYNGFGQLGDGTTTDSHTYAFVQNIGSDIRSISLGSYHSCALLGDGKVRCWGMNTHGQLGDGTTTHRSTPVEVVGLSGVTNISAGSHHTCALLANGTGMCWGHNGFGQLGDSTTIRRLTPVQVHNLTGAFDVSAGGSHNGVSHTCAVITGGTVKCWGANDQGQIGDGTFAQRRVATTVPNLAQTTTVEAGLAHTCALLSNRTVSCWGLNGHGQLGTATPLQRTVPGHVPGVSDVWNLSAGYDHNCVYHGDLSVTCWGRNDHGQLGIGTTSHSALPTKLAGLHVQSEVHAGGYHTCTNAETGTCWGRNERGQIGDGTTTLRASPTTSTALLNVHVSFTVDGTGSAVASTECRLDNEAFAPCVSWHGWEDIAPGAHTIAVRATDAVGHVSVATVSFNAVR